MKTLEQLFQYVLQAINRIFSPNEEPVPEVGVQPFEGDPYSDSSSWD
ncbi:hypothetical protein NIES970_10170 [[Synechococcus] sp. NIES-970]|nr:hypothetical protein NIES970_10170 [[Synechococcus] sp. NIES-970]